MEEKTKLTDDQKTENNEIIELKENDLSTISAGSDCGGAMYHSHQLHVILDTHENE